MSRLKNIAIIPARGGSKRIPRKNIKDFHGKPIIAYSIDAAIKSELFDEVMVSTDDKEIALVAKKYGASVPFMRSAKNSDDYATTADVLIEVINDYKEKLNKTYDNVCCIYPTAPFVTPRKLINSYKIFIEKGADSLIPVVKYSYPPQRSFILKGVFLKYREPKYINSRSQDLDPIYHDAGQFYWVKKDTLLKNKSLYSNKTIPFEMSEIEVQDIDNEYDWFLLEMKYQCV